MAITWIGADVGNFRAGRPGGFQPEAIVIHIMDGPMRVTDSWFNDPRSQVSAHYGVGSGGEVHQYVKETDTAFHAGTIVQPTWPLLKSRVNPNYYTIGVEHEGRGDIPWPWPQPQLAASIALIRDIAARWNIPLDGDHIVRHHAIRANKTCPGVNFDMTDYLQRLNGSAPPPRPAADTLPAPRQLRVLVNANLRQRPRTDAAIVRVLAAGDTFAATQVTTVGEAVRGNPIWYGNAAGQFVWAGTTDNPQNL